MKKGMKDNKSVFVQMRKFTTPHGNPAYRTVLLVTNQAKKSSTYVSSKVDHSSNSNLSLVNFQLNPRLTMK